MGAQDSTRVGGCEESHLTGQTTPELLILSPEIRRSAPDADEFGKGSVNIANTTSYICTAYCGVLLRPTADGLGFVSVSAVLGARAWFVRDLQHDHAITLLG